MSQTGDTQDAAKILIVEDEQLVAMDLEAELRGLGYTVVGLAATGKQALALTEQHCPELVLMDIQLAGARDGISTAGEIRRRWQIPVVFVTSFANPDILRRAKAVGPYGYLTKPFQSRDLHATVTMALEQHRLTQSIFQEHGWLRILLAGMRDGVVATDAAGQVKFLNPAAELLTGWTLVEALGRPIEDVYPLLTENAQPLAQCQLRQVLANNQPLGRERFLLRTRAGTVLPVEDSAAPIHDPQGQLVGAMTVIVDITERQQAEQQRQQLLTELQRANGELMRFSHTVAHDLQAPVRTVKSFAELLTRHHASQLQGAGTEFLTLITEAAAGMQQLIQALLQYAQVGQAALDCRPVSVAEVLATVQRHMAATLAEAQGEVQVGLLPTVWADAVQLQQLFQNLLSNAVRYRQPERTLEIVVTGEETADGWTLAVTDNGQGIPAEQLERIFAPLVRLQGAEIPGTGLGLALCRTIVERHGGRVWAESAGLGHGTTIRWTLPHPAEETTTP